MQIEIDVLDFAPKTFNIRNIFTQNSKPFYSTVGMKLYLVYAGKSIVYVGITNRRLRERLRAGLNATGKAGYYGYQWKKISKVRIYVIRGFETSFQLRDNSDTVAYFEAIEAEIVFTIRRSTGFWPKFQNEIHFNNEFKSAGKTAHQVLRAVDATSRSMKGRI